MMRSVTSVASGPIRVRSGDSRRAPFRERRSIPDTDLSVYPLALDASVFARAADDAASLRVLDQHHDLGGNFIDTAASDGGGRSEAVIGTWMRSRGTRGSTVIATKIGRHADYPGLSPRSIIGAVHASLDRLQTDYIDVLYFHLDDAAVPLEESLGAVDVLLRNGRVRYLAASNFTAERLMEARVLAANGLPRFVAVQSPYNLVERAAFESSLALLTQAQGMAVLPCCALAHGFLGGNDRVRAGALGRGWMVAKHLNGKSLRVLATVEAIAREHEVAPASIALAWLLARDGVIAPVAGASDPAQVARLMAAADIRLSRGDMIALDRVSA
jgi:aryl-alcohol dehydrogenase-like predicted oxidoreductase